MSVSEDRRNPKVSRVSLTTLVDICAQAEGDGPFQGESCNVSGRGMHVRTSYLPPIGEQLVCRFEHEDHEILVEGRVAWRSEGEDSGEFGIQFTALDADSAHVLNQLGHRQGAAKGQDPVAAEEDEEPRAEVGDFCAGQRVRLHIDGLGAPMKAAVHDGSERRIRVGSNLEFLKVGRALEVESVDGEAKRGATVDSVNVVVNPSSGVPELVVQLRYEGLSPTPPPTRTTALDPDGLDVAEAGLEPAMVEESCEPDDDAGPAAEKVRAYLDTAVSSSGYAARRASALLGLAWAGAQKTATKLVPAARPKTAGKVRSRFSGASAEPKSRRAQSASRRQAPSYLRSGIHDMGLTGKKASPASQKRAAPQKNGKGARWFLMGSAVVVLAGSAYALRSNASEAPAATAEQDVDAAVLPGTAQDGSSGAPTEEGPSAGASASEPPPPETPDGIVADVPLFGPKAMATAEPVKQEDDQGMDDATAEKRAAAAAVEDESWDEDSQPTESVEPWGRGRLHLPTVHRIRLDEAGSGLSGAIEPSGFTVVIPGSKAMESGRAIEKRDQRIVQVKASNTAQGARVRFEFRGPVPPYRVRLRKDFVEFLISAPQDGVAQL